jgi:hypothetical protein
MIRAITLALALCLSTEAMATGFVRGRLICATNVSRWLVDHGFRSPHSASSRDFLKYRRVTRSQARFGTVRFNPRRNGGHVMVVLDRSAHKCLNPSSRQQKWVVKPCPTGGIYIRTGRA